jgi:hypothetical protein
VRAARVNVIVEGFIFRTRTCTTHKKERKGDRQEKKKTRGRRIPAAKRPKRGKRKTRGDAGGGIGKKKEAGSYQQFSDLAFEYHTRDGYQKIALNLIILCIQPACVGLIPYLSSYWMS